LLAGPDERAVDNRCDCGQGQTLLYAQSLLLPL
jgi:hypothetical protein